MGHQLSKVNDIPVIALLKQCFMFINPFEKCSAEPLLKSILKLVTLHIVKLCGSPNIPNFLDFMRALEIFTKMNIVTPCRCPFGESWIHPCIVYVWRGVFVTDGDGTVTVKFGTLFSDDRCANLFEVLVGTLKAAKRKKVRTPHLVYHVHQHVRTMLQEIYRIFAPLWEIYGIKSRKFPITRAKIHYH